MNKTKKALLVGAITVAFGAGGYFSTPQGTDAASNVVLASVDWVSSQLNPVKTKVTALETKLATQEKEITSLKEQVAKLQNTTTPTAPATKSGKVYTIKDDVKIHSGASPKYKVLATKAKSATLEYVDTFNATDGLWYRVKVSSTVLGWVYSGNVSTSATASSADATTPSVASVSVTGDKVNVRTGATTRYPVLQTVAKGTVLVYHSTFVNSLGETWHNVQIPSGLKGWISGSQSEVL